MKNLIFLTIFAVFFASCSSLDAYKNFPKVEKISCTNCKFENAEFSGKINGYFYKSDTAPALFNQKLEYDKGLFLKKVYLRNIYDLEKNKKFVAKKKRLYLVQMDFNEAFEFYLKKELKARGIELVEGPQESIYAIGIDFAFVDFKAEIEHSNLNSSLLGTLKIMDLNRYQVFNLSTYQNVERMWNVYKAPFYTHLLLRQLAIKTANTILAL